MPQWSKPTGPTTFPPKEAVMNRFRKQTQKAGCYEIIVDGKLVRTFKDRESAEHAAYLLQARTKHCECWNLEEITEWYAIFF